MFIFYSSSLICMFPPVPSLCWVAWVRSNRMMSDSLCPRRQSLSKLAEDFIIPVRSSSLLLCIVFNCKWYGFWQVFLLLCFLFTSWCIIVFFLPSLLVYWIIMICFQVHTWEKLYLIVMRNCFETYCWGLGEGLTQWLWDLLHKHEVLNWTPSTM